MADPVNKECAYLQAANDFTSFRAWGHNSKLWRNAERIDTFTEMKLQTNHEVIGLL